MLPSPDPKYIFRGDMGCVHSLLFRQNSGNEFLFAGAASGTIHIWNLNTNRETSRISSGEDSCLSLLNIGEDLIVQQKCGLIKSYKLGETELLPQHVFNTDFCHYCRIQPFSTSELLVPLKNAIGILSMKSFQLEGKLDASNLPYFGKLGEAMAIKAVTDKLVLVVYEGGQLLLWDISGQKVLSQIEIDVTPMALDFDTNLMKGIVGGSSEQLQIFALAPTDNLSPIHKVQLRNPGTSIMRIRPDARIMAVGGWDSKLRIFAWRSLKPLAVLSQHRDTIHDIVFSDSRVQAYDDKYLMATGAKDGCIALWDVYN